MLGLDDVRDDVAITKATDIQQQFEGQNLTASDTVAMLDWMVQKVYHSTPNTRSSPYACDFNGLTTLTSCHSDEVGASGKNVPPTKTDPTTPIRAATMAGVFVPPPAWLLPPGKDSLSLSEATALYTKKDFLEMADLGLNTVQIPVPVTLSTNMEMTSALQEALEAIQEAGLQVILQLTAEIGATDTSVTEGAIAAAGWAASQGNVVMGVTLPKTKSRSVTESMIASIREKHLSLPLLIPVYEGDLTTWNLASLDDNVYAALEWSHSATVGDIASSNSEDDRSKLFYHESLACIKRSPLEFASCYRNLPVLVSSGFDLSIDNCVRQNEPDFPNYGQCDRFNETVASPWWAAHRESFAARQVYSFERGMGWSFATWKLLSSESDVESTGELSSPAQLLSLQDVAAAGLFPSLNDDSSNGQACLNPPENDFILGDDRLSPTQGPPPDCGDGRWNYTTSQCDFWVPPPTPSCPSCPCNESNVLGNETDIFVPILTSNPAVPTNALVHAALGGAVAALVLVAVVFQSCRCLGDYKRKNEGYSTLPN